MRGRSAGKRATAWRRSIIGAIAVGLVVCADASAAPSKTDVVASVVNAKGTAWIHRGGSRRSLQVGAQLSSADTLTTGTNGRVWIVYRNGALKKIGPRARLSFNKKPRQRRGRLAAIFSSLGLFGDPNQQAELSKIGGGIRPAGEQTFFVLTPRRSYVLSSSPELRWTAAPSAKRYQVKVASMVKTFFSQTVNGKTSIDLQARKVSLPRGQLCFVTVSAIAAGGGVIGRDETAFTVASETTTAELKQVATELAVDLKQEFGRDEFSYQMLLAELYLRKTFYADAHALLETLKRKRPEVEWVAQRMVTLRQLTGLPTKEKKK